MGFMNVYNHWLSPLSFVLALQVTATTVLNLLPFFPSIAVTPTFARTITSGYEPGQQQLNNNHTQLPLPSTDHYYHYVR